MGRTTRTVSTPTKDSVASLRTLLAETNQAGAETTAQVREIAARKLQEGISEFAGANQRTRAQLAKRTKPTRKALKANSTAVRQETMARAADLREPGRKASQAAMAAVLAAGKSGRRGKKDLAAAKKGFQAAVAEAKSAAKGERARHRRWPWLLGAGVVAATGTAYVRRTTRPEEVAAPAPAGKHTAEPTALTSPAPPIVPLRAAESQSAKRR